MNKLDQNLEFVIPQKFILSIFLMILGYLRCKLEILEKQGVDFPTHKLPES